MTRDQADAEAGFRRLVEWASSLSTDDIPTDVLRESALILGDELATAVAGRDEPEVARMQARLIEKAGLAEATIFRGGRARTDRYGAALANGTAANWCELDGGYRKKECHGGLYAVPALAAEAEAEAVGTRDILRALALAYEVMTRVARCWTYDRVLVHPHARYSGLGAAAAIGLVRGLPPNRLLDALTAAATVTLIGLQSHAKLGALIENVWAGLGAANGMRCVDWAECGIAGLAGAPAEVFGTVLGGSCDHQALTEGLGEEWAVSYTFHRIYACNSRMHAGVEALLALMEAEPDLKGGERVAEFVVIAHDHHLANAEPRTSLAARYSIPHAMAATLVFGRADAEATSAPTIAKPEVARLRQMVEIRPYEPRLPWPRDRAMRVEITLTDGRTLSRETEVARGTPTNPFSDDEILDKISRLTGGEYPRFAPVMGEVIALDPARLVQPWTGIVDEMTGPVVPG
jgi:2-methylcitrate dehydratase PrpD